MGLRDWPGSVLTEYRFAFRQVFARGILSLVAEDQPWKIERKRDAAIAFLPPVLLGVGIALGALVRCPTLALLSMRG